MTEIARNMTTSSSPPFVVALAYDGLCTFEFGVTVEIFGLPRPEFGDNWYRFAVAAIEEGPLRATGGIRIMTDGGYALLEEADTLIIPGWRSPEATVPPQLCQALQRAHRRGCRLLSICSGVFVLAAAGLLDKRQATTHWRYTPLLQQRYPAIQVVNDVLYVGDEQIMTSAGSAAGIDLCLHVVQHDFGLEVANRVAHRLVIPPHRDGGQPQQRTRPVARSHESQRLSQLFDWLQQNIAEEHSLESLAQRVGMSPRTLLRRFQESTGMTPARWVLDERLSRARQSLIATRLSIEKIAENTGFGTPGSLRHHFQQRFSMSPMAYRKKFTADNN